LPLSLSRLYVRVIHSRSGTVFLWLQWYVTFHLCSFIFAHFAHPILTHQLHLVISFLLTTSQALALLSSFDISCSTLTSSAPAFLAVTTVIYGLRLAFYLLLREFSVDSKRKQVKSFDKMPRLQRTPLALSVSLLYAFMTSPALFALRGLVKTGTALEKVQLVSTGVSVFGMVLESIADQQKYEAKRKSKEGEDKFVGPTTWSYKLVRHPNYLGEILFWVGLFGAGSVSFQKSIVAWLCGSLGLASILSIMFGASGRLDTKQQEKYGGQRKYEEWKDSVKYSVIPFFK
jgi:steroid 5-alpha reductase family enzyme